MNIMTRHRILSLVFFSIALQLPLCWGMEQEKSYRSTNEKARKEVLKLLSYYKKNDYKRAEKIMSLYDPNFQTLLCPLSEETHNTIAHELGLLINKKNFKSIFHALYVLLNHHPELATQENSDYCLPLNCIDNISEKKMIALCWLMREPQNQEKHAYYLPKKRKKRESIKKAYSLYLFSHSTFPTDLNSKSLSESDLRKNNKN